MFPRYTSSRARRSSPQRPRNSRRAWRLVLLALLCAVGLVAAVVAQADPPTGTFSCSPSTISSFQTITCSSSDAADSDGEPFDTTWNFGDGSGWGTSNQHAYSKAGDYTVTMRLDNHVDPAVDVTNTVHVNDLAPTASFTHQPTSPGHSVAFDASASSDSDGTIASYSWDFGDGTSGSGKTPTHTYAIAAIYTVTLTVTDDSGSTAFTPQQVQITDAPPTASFTTAPAAVNPGQSVAVNPGQSVSFDGSRSTDPDGTVASYSWDFGDGTTDTTSGATPPPHVFASPGNYTVSLQVTDNDRSQSPPATQTVHVNAPPAAAFHSSTDAPLAGNSVQFSSDSTDPDSDPLTYSWDFGDGTPSSSSPNPTHSYSTAGIYQVKLTVTDPGGLGNTAVRTIAVQATQPRADFSFQPGAMAPLGQNVTFTASATATQGQTITGVEWDFDYNGTQFTPDLTGSSVQHGFSTPGAHTVALKVTQSDGGYNLITHSVTVDAPPVAGFSFTPASPTTGQKIVLSSSSFDPDGPLSSLQWDLNGDGKWTDASGSTVSTQFKKAGKYTIRLRVTDPQGASSIATQVVTVKARRMRVVPGVVIDMGGLLRGRTTIVRLLAVHAPRGSRAVVHCYGRSCSRHPGALRSHGHALRFRQFEHSLAPGTRIVVTVTKRGFIGRITSFVMRAGQPPYRADLCLRPGSRRPVKCPSR